MARIKYQPSTKVRSFNPIQISKEGISQLRNENNRVIQGLQNNFQAEKEQQERERAAMEENAALEEARINRDREIEIENLKNEERALAQQASFERQQASFDAEAKSTFYNTLVDFSKTAIAKAAENHANMIKDQTAIANSTDITELVERVKNYNEVEQTQIQGGIVLDTETQVEALESGEKRLETLRAFISNPALGDVQNRVIQNRVLKEAFPLMVGDALRGTEAIYEDGAGNKFSGIEAQRDPTKMGIVSSQVERDLRDRVGVDLAEPGRFNDGLTTIQERKVALQNQANTKAIADSEDILKQQAVDLASDNTTKGYTAAFHKMKMLSKEEAHAFTETLIANPANNKEAIDRMDLLGDGRRYSEVWPNRWAAGLAKSRENEVKAFKAQTAFKKAQLQQFEAENADIIRQSYVENFPQAKKATLQRSYESGLPPSELMKSIERSVMADLEDQEEEKLFEKIRFSSLDKSFVNSIQAPTVKTQAIEAFKEQEERKYGPAALGIKKGFRATARKLTNINPNEGNDSPQTFLVQARLETEYLKALEITQDPVAANAKVNEMIDAAAKGDKNSPFYTETGANNRQVFTNIETVDKDLVEKNMMIDKNMVTFGADVASQAGLLATPDEMDATIASAQYNGKVIYPLGILRVADKFGLKPSEVFNQQRKANNLVTGEKKPLLTPSIGTNVVDGLSPANREVYMKSQEFRSTKMARRVSSGIDGTIQNYVRSSMGGLNQSFNSDSIPSGYGSVIFDAASRNGIPPSILAGLIATESAFDPNAVSPAGARGLGQFMPPTAAEFNVNVNDPVSSIDGAARYLRYLTDYFKGDLEKAIYAYNGGMGNIEKFNGPIPGNQENQEYFNKVITNSNRYK